MNDYKITFKDQHLVNGHCLLDDFFAGKNYFSH